MILRALCALAVALLIGGCGDSGTTPEEEAQGTVAVFLEACAGDRPEQALDMLSEPLRRSFIAAGDTLDGCSTVAGTDSADGPAPFALGELAEVSVDSGFGTARIDSPVGPFELELEQDKGRWQISQPPSA